MTSEVGVGGRLVANSGALAGRLYRRTRRKLAELASGNVELHTLLMLGLIVTNGITAVLADKIDKGWSLWAVTAVGVLVSVLIWRINENRVQRVTEERIRARSETLVDLGYSLEPLIRDLGRTMAMKRIERRRKMQSGHRKAIVAASANLGQPNARLRACYFLMEASDPTMPRRLQFEGTAIGRADPPKAEFVAGTPEGDAALAMVDAGSYLYCDDVEQSPPPGWVPTERGAYKTFISVTVGVPGRPHGMLTLDAPDVGSLVKEDVHMLVVLGHLLGIAEEVTA